MTAVLRTAGLTGGYRRVEVLRGVDLELTEARLTVVIGPNGAGKSTLAKCLFGLADITGGCAEVRVGDEWRTLTGARTADLTLLGLNFVPQVEDVFPSLSVQDNLVVGGSTARRDIPKRIHEIYDRIPMLRDRRRQPAGSLSGGERKQLAVARALMSHPRVLVMDEPTAGMAPRVVEDFFALVHDLCDAGLSVLLVEQNARRALQAADFGLVLDMGASALFGTGAELLADPKVAELYLGGAGARNKTGPDPTHPRTAADDLEAST